MPTNENTLRFVALQSDVHAGINKNSKIKVPTVSDYFAEETRELNPNATALLLFSSSLRVVMAEGDSAAGKTSWINQMIEACGGEPVVNAVNKETGNKKFTTRFWGKDGHFYEAQFSRTETKLYRFDTDENGKIKFNGDPENYIKSEVRGAKGMLRSIIGPAGTSPLVVASYAPAKQIEWIRKLYKPGAAALKEETDIITEYKEKFEERTAVGRDITRLQGKLDSSDYYTDAETWLTFFDVGAEKYKDIPAQMQAVQKNYQEYQQVETSIAHYESELNANVSILDRNESDINHWMKEIKALQKKIDDAQKQSAKVKEDVEQTQVTKDAAEMWINEHSAYKADYDNIAQLSQESIDFESKKKDYEAVLLDVEELNLHKVTRDKLTQEIEVLSTKKKNLVKQYTPNIPEFEVCVPDAEDPREGLFYKKLPINHINESGNWDWFLIMCPQVNISVILIDNVNTLGSETYDRLNRLLDEDPNVWLFVTQMNRKAEKQVVTISLKHNLN